MTDRSNPFAAIERLGREMAGAIAAEFTAHRQARAPRVPDSLTEPAAPNELAGELVDWVDFMSDIARESIFAMADFGDSRSAAASGLRARFEIGQQPIEPVHFWLHSAQGSAETVEPTVAPLTNERGDQLLVAVVPPSARVTPDEPARFQLEPTTLAGVAPGEYHGSLRADGVRAPMPIVIEVGQ